MTTSQYHLRITTESGKTWRSRPLLPATPKSLVRLPLRVYSDTRGDALDVRVSEHRIPHLKYEFSPRFGAILHTDAGRPFWAHSGGYIDTSTGRGGNEGGASATLFFPARSTYPADARCCAPAWVDSGDGHSLRFDGVGTFLLLPREALPHRGSFTLSFDVKPASDKPALLFAHRSRRLSSLELFLRDGRLGGAFTTQEQKRFDFSSGLRVEAGTWSTIEAIYDLNRMRLRVNGVEESFVCRGPGLDIGPSVMGGYGPGGQAGVYQGNTNWYGGLIRNLVIVHNGPRP